MIVPQVILYNVRYVFDVFCSFYHIFCLFCVSQVVQKRFLDEVKKN